MSPIRQLFPPIVRTKGFLLQTTPRVFSRELHWNTEHSSSTTRRRRTTRRCFSSASDTDTPLDDNGAGGSASSSNKRNPALALVIREGLLFLNQTSCYIQESKHTKKPLFSAANNSSSSSLSPAQLAEGHRLLDAASDCLEELCGNRRPGHHNDARALMIRGEPIVLLHVHVHPSLQHATIYWTLPLSILWDDNDDDDNNKNNNDDDDNFKDTIKKHQLTLLLQEQFRNPESRAAKALKQLQRRLYSRLSHYKAPKIVWEPATPEMLYALVRYQHHFFEDDHDNDKR